VCNVRVVCSAFYTQLSYNHLSIYVCLSVCMYLSIYLSSCLKPSRDCISLSRSWATSGTLALTSQRPSGQTALPRVRLATTRAWLPCSTCTQQPRQRPVHGEAQTCE
jgi:hypothetical protein